MDLGGDIIKVADFFTQQVQAVAAHIASAQKDIPGQFPLNEQAPLFDVGIMGFREAEDAGWVADKLKIVAAIGGEVRKRYSGRTLTENK